MSWLLCEVRDGTTDIDSSEDVSVFILDWDTVEDDEQYAADKLRELTELGSELPDDHAARLRDRIHAVWPHLAPPVADWPECGGPR